MQNTKWLPAVLASLAVGCGGAAIAQENAAAAAPALLPHSIGAAKLIIGDVATTQAFYEQMFGMKEVRRYSDPALYEEPIMGFEAGARLALFAPKAEAPLQKSRYPVALIYTPEFDALTKRIEDAKHPLQRLPAAQSGPFRIAIVRDPSGNAIEILAREGKSEVGGAKLIVTDRQKAEDFYAQVFNVKPVQRYQSPAYDEVLMGFGPGAFLALFQPLNEAALPKSQFPVVAIYTSEFDAVRQRVTERGLGYREVKTSTPNLRIIIAKDPAGNGVEIISR
jgi:catechol 2,3-dioxygenase-like lactoylglutathione lyase family enzyme